MYTILANVNIFKISFSKSLKKTKGFEPQDEGRTVIKLMY